MTRFSGRVGFVIPTRVDGVVEDAITERDAKGDEIRNTRYFRNGDSVLGETSLQTRLSIMADTYSLENYADIRYAVVAGTPWEVTQASLERPRLVLVLGDRYTGPLAEPSDE